MEKVECSSMKDGNGSIRKYFDFESIRMMLGVNYVDTEGWHMHAEAHQIIYVISGALRVFAKNKVDAISNYVIVAEDEFLSLPAGEWHNVTPNIEGTKILVLKYHSNKTNIIKSLKEDYIGMK